MDNKDLLISLYEQAKAKRVVLNQDEFAKAMGVSRAHLFKKMEVIPQRVIDKAKVLLETGFVSNETETAHFKGEPVDIIKDFESRLIALESFMSVALQVFSDQLADKTGKQPSLIGAELQEAVMKVAELRIRKASK